MQIHLYSATARGRFGSVLKDIFGVLVLGELLNVSHVTMDATMVPAWYRPLPHDASANVCEAARIEHTAHLDLKRRSGPWKRCRGFPTRFAFPRISRGHAPGAGRVGARRRVPLDTLEGIVARMRFPKARFPVKQGAVRATRRPCFRPEDCPLCRSSRP